MRHFNYLSEQMVQTVFQYPPADIHSRSPRELLSYSLGATLYMPGTRKQISNDVLNSIKPDEKNAGLTSIVLCLEDAIGDDDVYLAEANIISQLHMIFQSVSSSIQKKQELPLIFIRVRQAEQIESLLQGMGQASELICGFVFPKFNANNGQAFLEALHQANQTFGHNFYALPILESSDIIYKETRMTALLAIKALLDQHYESILNIRIGATDFSGLFGIRRDSDTTIYDIAVIQDCIMDIINVFGRAEKEYVISGPVWEYFNGTKRIMKPKIRQTPFQTTNEARGLAFRSELISRCEDALIQEVLLDKTNGLSGKTIIHPTHIRIVNALSAVNHEEYMDAMSVIEHSGGSHGVIKSLYDNKMNEIKPHYHWARKILLKSKVFGVLHEHQTFIDLLKLTGPIHV